MDMTKIVLLTGNGLSPVVLFEYKRPVPYQQIDKKLQTIASQIFRSWDFLPHGMPGIKGDTGMLIISKKIKEPDCQL